MKNKIYLLFVFVLSFFVFCNVVNADNNMAMWLDCNYKVYADDAKKLETGRPLVFIGGWQSDTVSVGYYRLLNSKTFEEHSPALNTWIDNDNPRFNDDDEGGCWFYDEADIGKSCNDKSVGKYSKTETMQMLRKGICPAIIRDADGLKSNEVIVFAGIGTGTAYKLTNQYRFYKNNQSVYAYGYDLNGFFIQTENGNIVESYSEKYYSLNQNLILSPSSLLVEKYGNEFMNVGEFDDAGIFVPNDVELVFDSNNNISKLYNSIDSWYSNFEAGLNDKGNKISEIESDYTQLINTCSSLSKDYDNGNKYNFSSSYTASMMLNDLDKMYFDLYSFYDAYSNVEYELYTSNDTTDEAVFSAYNYAMIDLLGSIDYVPKQLNEFVLDDVAEYLKTEKNMVLVSDGDVILKNALKCSAYLDINYSDLGLNSTETSNIFNKYSELAGGRGIHFVYDCKSLLGEDLIAKINSYLNIIKIAIPIILIAFGVLDYTRALFAGDDEMKKAQKDFIKRIFIAILVFLTPTIVNFILSIANVVWSNISPNSCGLF